MKNSLNINGFDSKFKSLMDSNKTEEAIQLIYNTTHQIVISKKFKGVCLRLPELDAGLIRIAEKLKPHFGPPLNEQSEHVCLVTEFHNAGGHRSILNSICEEIPSHVIFTDLFKKINDGLIKLDPITPKALSTTIIDANDFTGKIKNLLAILNSLSPKHLWVFSHHQDVIALLAALIFDNGRRTIFVHHCDHEPALGASIKFPIHYDFSHEISKNCNSIGLKSSLLALYTRAARRRINFNQKKFTIFTAGSLGKYLGMKAGISYKDIVKTILTHPKVNEYHHIGEFSLEFAADLRNELIKSGIDPDKFTLTGRVSSISDYALSIGANVYFSSFPVGGGATTAEVQSAGIPVLFFDSNHNEMPLYSISSVYGSIDLEWRSLDNIHPLLDKVFINWNFYSDLSFQKYNEISSKEIFLTQITHIR